MSWLPNMGSPIWGSSDLSIIGENRRLRKWVNIRETKIVPKKHSKGLRLHLTQNWALTNLEKYLTCSGLWVTVRGWAKISQRTKTKTPSTYRIHEQFIIYNTITLNLICLMIYILKFRVQNPLVWNNPRPHIRKPPYNRRHSAILFSDRKTM